MLARIVRSGQSTPRRGLVWAWPGCQWKPLQSLGNHSGNHRLATITVDNRLPLWFAPGSRKRVRTRSANLGANLPQVRNQNAYQPCVSVCALAGRNLCSYCAIRGEPSLRPNRLHPAGHHAAQCVNMLREECVKPLRGKASRIDQVRDGRARNNAREPRMPAPIGCRTDAMRPPATGPVHIPRS